MSLRVRVLLFLTALIVVSVLPLAAPWPVVIATVVYLVIVFPALKPTSQRKSRARGTEGQVRCEVCDRPTRRIAHPYGGDSWYFECDRGHHTIIGK